MKTFAEIKSRLLNDPEFRREYDTLEDEFNLIEMLIKQRLKLEIAKSLDIS